ncbi:U4/U6 small nuclear ribonucleoprotein Prp31 [Tanacetum coccineum]
MNNSFFISEKYCLKFPQLASLVRHPIDYARVVKKLGNQVDLTLVDLEGILPSDTINIMALSVSPASLRLLLPEDVLEKTIEACDRAILLDASKKKVLSYVEYRMRYIKAMRKLAKKFWLSAPGPGGKGHPQFGKVSEGKLCLTVGQIKQIAAIDKMFVMISLLFFVGFHFAKRVCAGLDVTQLSNPKQKSFTLSAVRRIVTHE